MQRFEKELRVKDMNESEKDWKSKKLFKREEDKLNEHQYDIEDNWD